MPTRILIVEDNVLHAERLSTQLMSFGCEIAGIESRGEDAIEFVFGATEPPDIIIMDIHLRGNIDGVDAARQINKGLTDDCIPIIYLTAYSDIRTKMRVDTTVHYGFLNKPFNQRQLCDAIGTINFCVSMPATGRPSFNNP